MLETIVCFVKTNIETFISIFIGGLITWIVAWFYYVKASRELAAEAKELRHKNNLMLRVLESAGFIKLSKDEKGEYKGIVHETSGAPVGPGSALNGTSTNTHK